MNFVTYCHLVRRDFTKEEFYYESRETEQDIRDGRVHTHTLAPVYATAFVVAHHHGEDFQLLCLAQAATRLCAPDSCSCWYVLFR